MECYSTAGSQRFVSQCLCHDGLSHLSCLVAVAVVRRRSDVFSALGTTTADDTAAGRQIGTPLGDVSLYDRKVTQVEMASPCGFWQCLSRIPEGTPVETEMIMEVEMDQDRRGCPRPDPPKLGYFG